MANYDYNHLSGEYLCEQRRKYPVKETISPKDAAILDILTAVARNDGSLDRTLEMLGRRKYNSEFERNKLLTLYHNYYNFLTEEIYSFLRTHTKADIIYMPPEAEVQPEGFDKPVKVSPTLVFRWEETEKDGSITPHRQAITIKTNITMKNELTNYVQLEYLKKVLDETANITPLDEQRTEDEDRTGIINPVKYHTQYWTVKDDKTGINVAKSREDKNVDYVAKAKEFSEKGFVISKSTCATCSCNSICYFSMPTKKDESQEVKRQSLTAALTSDPQDNIISRFRQGIGKCVAVPGAGKTFVLSAYIANLIIEGVPAEKIWAATFTNLGAKEIQERVRQYLEEYGLADEADKLYMGTFHGFCENLISQFYKEMGYDEPPVVADGIEEATLVKQVLATTYVPNIDYTSFYSPYARYNGVLTTLEKFRKFKKDGNSLRLSEHELNAYYKYANLKEANNILDFDDVIEFAKKLTIAKPNVWNDFGYQYILVDEFQDTNSQQIEILKLLQNNRDWKGTLIVGDEDQSIYSFQGADVRLFDNIHNLLDPGNRLKHYDFPLNDNYRSTTPIADVANQIREIFPSGNNNKEVKCLRDGESVVNQYFDNDKSEIEYISNITKKVFEEGREVAVIARTNAQLDKIGEALSKLGIPSTKIGSDAYNNDARVKVIYALADIVNHSENPSRLNVAIFANACVDGELRDMSDEEREATIDEFYELITNLNPEAKIENFKELAKGMESNEVLEDFLSRCDRKKKWEDLYGYIKDFKTYGQKETFRNPNKVSNVVNLVTAHSSKGLEWDTVIGCMTGFEDAYGKFGREDARLLFVMATRAKNHLYMTGNGWRKNGSELEKAACINHYAEVTGTKNELNKALGINIMQTQGKSIQMTNKRKTVTFNTKNKTENDKADKKSLEGEVKVKSEKDNEKENQGQTLTEPAPRRRGRPRKNPVEVPTQEVTTQQPEVALNERT